MLQKCFVSKPNNVSFLNNFLALSYGRNILSNKVLNGNFNFEFVNNIIYGHKYGTSGAEAGRFSIINNKYRRTKDERLDVNFEITLAPIDPENGDSWGTIEDTRIYVSGNNVQTDIKTSNSGYSYGPGYSPGQVIHRSDLKKYLISEPYGSSGYVATSAEGNALENKLFNHIGCSLKRDDVDERFINSYNNFSGLFGNSGTFPIINNGDPYVDSDNDGIDDLWEANINGTVGVADNNGDHDGDGYTNLEEFLHYLAKD